MKEKVQLIVHNHIEELYRQFRIPTNYRKELWDNAVQFFPTLTDMRLFIHIVSKTNLLTTLYKSEKFSQTYPNLIQKIFVNEQHGIYHLHIHAVKGEGG